MHRVRGDKKKTASDKHFVAPSFCLKSFLTATVEVGPGGGVVGLLRYVPSP